MIGVDLRKPIWADGHGDLVDTDHDQTLIVGMDAAQVQHGAEQFARCWSQSLWQAMPLWSASSPAR